MGRIFPAGGASFRNLDGAARRPRAAARARLAEDRGFTLIEVLAASLILTIGLLAAYMMLSVATHSTADVRAREGAVTLARQITDDAREIPYSQISSATIVGQLQAMPGLASSSSGSAWTIVRNGVTYTVTVTESAYNDTKDPGGGGANDFKQVTATVSWKTYQGLTHQISETATMTRAGLDPGLPATGLQLLQSQWSGAPAGQFSGSVTAPVVTSSSVTSLQFQVSAPSGTSAIVWSLNGARQSSWSGSAPTGGSTTWVSAPWSIPVGGASPVYDGTYTVTAQAEDASGTPGPGISISVRLIRSSPSAPSVDGDGFNGNFPGGPSLVAELQWSPNPELNVVGYRLINSASQVVCQTSTTATYPAACGSSGWCQSLTACVDFGASASNLTYQVAALYYDANNNLRQGAAQTVTLAGGGPAPPPAPVGPLTVAAQSDGSAYLTWTPPSGGTAVSFYRIYRDAYNYADRYDTLPASACSSTCAYHDTARSGAHSYWVTAVGGTTAGADMAESTALGPTNG